MRAMTVTAVILVLIIAGWSRLGFPQVREVNADSWPATNDLILYLPFDPDIKPVIAWSHGKSLQSVDLSSYRRLYERNL